LPFGFLEYVSRGRALGARKGPALSQMLAPISNESATPSQKPFWESVPCHEDARSG